LPGFVRTSPSSSSATRRRAASVGGAGLTYPGLHAQWLLPGGALAVAAPAALSGALCLTPGALLHRHRDSSRRHDRARLLHRSRHGRRHRRDRGDRRECHALSRRHPGRRELAQGEASPHRRRSCRRRRGGEGAGADHHRRTLAHRRQLGGGQGCRAAFGGRRRTGARAPSRRCASGGRTARRLAAQRPARHDDGACCSRCRHAWPPSKSELAQEELHLDAQKVVERNGYQGPWGI
jgi:hypothetical protein